MAGDKSKNYVTMRPNGIGQTYGGTKFATGKVIKGKRIEHDFRLYASSRKGSPSAKE
jgi:hypothetical protein